MRLLFLLLFATGLSTASAQQINGIARDSEGKPLGGVTISLLKDTGAAVLKLTVSGDNGSFRFAEIKPGKYRVSASHIAYQPQVSASFTLEASDVTVPEFKLSKASADMKGVVVTARKPVIEVKADKTILNVEGTINAVGSDALELLRKSPGVTVDKDENLSLSGKNGVQVYIDGRPSPLAGQDLANYLKTLQSSNIEAIELITNPSAKYEAAGNAGIINIRLKKNKSFGMNGSVNAGWNIGVFAKYNAGLSLNYRNSKLNIFGNYNYNQGRNWSRIDIRRTTGDSLFDQKSQVNMDNLSHNFKAGIDLFLNKKSTLGAMVNGNIAKPSISNYSRTPISHIPTGTTDRILVADNSTALKRNNINLNLNYSYTGSDGRTLNLNADHGIYDIESDQLQPNFYYSADGRNLLSTVVYQMIAPTDISINSVKADYEQNFMKGKLGLGGKLAYVGTDNDFQRYNVYGSTKELDRDRSNLFEYTENINAGYVNYNRAFKGMVVQAGLRVENTIAKGVSNGQRHNGSGYEKYDSVFKRNYTDFFPSAAITFNKNPMSQLSFTYSRRIDRPAYQDLNPFEFKLDEYSSQKGNIDLRPQYTNSIGITHTFKYKLNTTLNFSRVKDLFTQLIDTAEGSKAFISKRNIASQDVVSLNVSYPFTYKSYTLFTNLNSNYSRYKADFGSGRTINIDAVALNIYTQNSLRFAKTWTAELIAFYNAPTVYMGNFRGRTIWSIDAGMQKQVMKGKGTVRASVSDIFGTLRFRGTSEFAGQTSIVNTRWESRQFKLNFVYRFGSNQVKAARQRSTGAEEETKRVQQGGGGIGIGQ
ncbi:MAG TPA: TonB-dependent receptor [Flavisolibacter sp.]|nr:TonB-dependent receptor [Flavisolibacter sp.]